MELTAQQQEKLARLIRNHERAQRWRNDPIAYMHERLGIRPETMDWSLLPEYANHKWDGTENPFKLIASSLAASEWVGVKSSVGVGKTLFGACTALWFFENFQNSIVVTTAPKEDQLSLHIWKEIGRICARVPDIGKLKSLRMQMHEGKDDWIITGFVAGIKANEESATKAQGFHAEHMLIIFEETPGLPQQTINALVNTAVAPHNIILALGNPDSQMDPLSRFCSIPGVVTVRISSFDHPNVVLDNPLFIAGAATRDSIEKKKVTLGGEDSPMYLSRVRGIAPAQSSDSLIRIEWCTKAKDREKFAGGHIGLGVDVANSENGDLAAIARGIGQNLIEVRADRCPNANDLGHMVAQMIFDDKIDPGFVGVDGVGVGAGTVNTLKEYGLGILNILSGIAMIDVVGSVEVFNNLRSQMWWTMREDLRKGEITLPNDDELFTDLVTPRWTIKNGKITIEAKDEIKKRLGRSPNKGDAVVYWNWARTRRETVAAVGSSEKMEEPEVQPPVIYGDRQSKFAKRFQRSF